MSKCSCGCFKQPVLVLLSWSDLFSFGYSRKFAVANKEQYSKYSRLCGYNEPDDGPALHFLANMKARFSVPQSEIANSNF